MTTGHALDPYAAQFQQDPFPVYARLREADPVHLVEGHGWYMVSSMELVKEALRRPEIFANSVTSARRSEPPAEVAAEVAAIRAQGHPYVPALNLNDPPIHTRYRKLINRAFTPRSIAWMEPLVESVAQELAADLARAAPGPVDIIATVTQPLPVFAILRILGLDDDRRTDIVRWSEAATASLGRRLSPAEWVQAERDNLDFQLAMAAEMTERRRAPRTDLLSNLVHTEDGEQPLPIGELVWLARELLVAGNETTTRALAEAVLGLHERPADWDRLRSEPAKAAAEVAEEAIRLSTPAFGMFRRVTADTVLGGVELPAESVVFLAYGAANRDPALFDDPESFRPGRENARDHVAFGHGIHVCVGAALARLESSASLRAMARAVDRLEVVDPDRVAYLPSFFLRGIVELPVLVHPRSVS
jgi:cytochrome P450